MSRYDRASHRFYRDLRSDRWCGLVAGNPSKRGRTLEKAGCGVVMGAQRIYFIKVMGFIKIGVYSDLKSRVSRLQTGCPVSLVVLGTLPVDSDPFKQERDLAASWALVKSSSISS
jgi:hypothetical protein